MSGNAVSIATKGVISPRPGGVFGAPPTWDSSIGINALTRNTVKNIIVVSAGTATADADNVDYATYIQAGTTASLFASANLIGDFESPSNIVISHLPTLSRINANTTYFVGIRAVNRVGRAGTTNTNTLSG